MILKHKLNLCTVNYNYGGIQNEITHQNNMWLVIFMHKSAAEPNV